MRTRKTVVILISGKAGAGKSTVANLLKTKMKDFPSITVFGYSFANPIKYLAKAYGNWDGNKDGAGRILLQGIGKTFRDYDQDIWVKHFINQLDKQSGMLPFNFAIIDDWRFPNELNFLRKNPLLDIVTIRVFGRKCETMTSEEWSDVSENSLPEVSTEHLEVSNWEEGEKESYVAYYDYQIDNSENLDLLESKLDLILANIEKQYIV